MLRYLTAIALLLQPGIIMANTPDIVRQVSPINSLPVAQQINRSDDKPVTTIDTGQIRSGGGELARGPHDITFELDRDASYSVFVNGHRVNPGESVTMVINLTEVAHRLILPVYPADSTPAGKANYELHIPFLNTRLCPAGFDERPQDCYRIDFTEINYICPADFSFSNTLEDCVRTHTLNLSYECPQGYTQNGDRCTRSFTTEYTYECPADFYFNGTECAKEIFENTLTCEEGFTYNVSNGRCQNQIDTYEAQAPCPIGFTLDGNDCVRTKTLNPTDTYCPSSHPNSLDGRDDACYRVQPQPVNLPAPANESACWVGFEWRGGQCIELENVSYTCPDNSLFQNGECLREERLPSGYYCDNTPSPTSECRVYQFSETGTFCPESYTHHADTNSCIRIENTSPIKVCTDGYSLNAEGNSCEREEKIELQISCPSGMNRSEDGAFCYEQKSQPAQQQCPAGAGWTKNGTQCNFFASENVTSCPAGYALRNGSCHLLSDKLQSCPVGYVNNGSGTCLRQEEKSANPVCASGYSYSSSNKRCERSETQKASSGESCPMWYVREGAGCIRKTSPKESCRSSASWDNTSGGQVGPSCSGPLVREKDGDCFYEPTPVQGAQCFRHSAKPELTCPSGTTRQGSQCVSAPIPPNIYHICPVGWTQSGSTCSRVLTQSNGWSCPNGWSKSGSLCSRTLTDDVNYYCDGGHLSYSSAQCYAPSPDNSVGSCQNNFILNSGNGNCEHIDAQEVTYICPTTSHWSNNPPVCDFYREQNLNINCPSGYSVRGALEGCVRQLRENPTYSCPNGFVPTSSNDRCYREIVVPHL